jgi:hypothetical protein
MNPHLEERGLPPLKEEKLRKGDFSMNVDTITDSEEARFSLELKHGEERIALYCAPKLPELVVRFFAASGPNGELDEAWTGMEENAPALRFLRFGAKAALEDEGEES